MQLSVLVLDDDQDCRETIAMALATTLDAKTVLAANLSELQACSGEALATDVALLDINLGPDQPTGIDAYAWLRRVGYAGRIVFLTGHACSHPMVREARALGDASLLSKPLALGALVDAARGSAE